MKREYLETSIIGASLDNGEPFRRDLTFVGEHDCAVSRGGISQIVVRG